MGEIIIHVYSDQSSPRLKYTLDLVFKNVLHVDYQLDHDFESFKTLNEPKINYSKKNDETSISIKPDFLLFETGLSDRRIKMGEWEGLPAFFKTDENGIIPYDIFSMIFYLVSRYEEYFDAGNLDQYGRFKAEASLAFQNRFLDKPLVNQLSLKLAEKISARFPEFKFQKNTYKYLPTFDVDMAFSYFAKGFWRNAGGFIRSIVKMEFGKIRERFKVLNGSLPDPFNNFDFIIESLQAEGYEPIFFMNLGNYGKYDKNVPFQNLAFFRLLQHLNQYAQLNIHPSYASNFKTSLLKDEIAKLEHILGSSVLRSRQHFLMLKWPDTYQNLLQQGILEDYSLGYASQLGFRASICTPFNFYNLLKEEETSLTLRPFAFMDGTLMDYLKLEENEILNAIRALSKEVKSVGGDLIGIWHNSAFACNDRLKSIFLQTLSSLKL